MISLFQPARIDRLNRIIASRPISSLNWINVLKKRRKRLKFHPECLYSRCKVLLKGGTRQPLSLTSMAADRWALNHLGSSCSAFFAPIIFKRHSITLIVYSIKDNTTFKITAAKSSRKCSIELTFFDDRWQKFVSLNWERPKVDSIRTGIRGSTKPCPNKIAEKLKFLSKKMMKLFFTKQLKFPFRVQFSFSLCSV